MTVGLNRAAVETALGCGGLRLMALTETAQSCSSKVLTLSGRQGSG